MRILQVSVNGLSNGGVQSVIMDICSNIHDAHFDILLFTNNVTYYEKDFIKLGGKIFRIPNYEGENKWKKKSDYYIRFFRIFFGTLKILKQEKYDVIHCHNDLESAICSLAAYLANVKVRISHSHQSANRFSHKFMFSHSYKKLLQFILNKVSTVRIGVTEEAFVSLFGKRIQRKTNSLIVPNSIDLDFFKKHDNNKEKEVVKRIVNVGRFDENKNQLFIIEVLRHLINKDKNVALQLVGWGDDYQSLLKDSIRNFRLEEYVEFLPSNSDVKEVLEKADLFVFPSKIEGFGIALLEAQAMQVPCLVSDTVPRLVDCGMCKFVSLTEEKQVWSEQITNILNNNHNLNLDLDRLRDFDTKKYVNFIENVYRGRKYESWNAYFSQS